MRVPRFAAAALYVLPPILMIACGGGGGSAPPPPAQPSFSISTAPASISVQQGATSGSVSVSVTSQNGFSGSVSIAVEGLPSGVTSLPTSPFSLGAGASQQVTFSASASAATGNATITFRGTSGTLSHTAALALTVRFTLGGGTLTIVPRTSGQFALTSDAATYITKLVADMTGPGFLYDVCGSAASSKTVEVIFDVSDGFFHFEAGVNPTIHIPRLPNPGSTGTDKSFDEPFVHESSHALRNDEFLLNRALTNTDGPFADVEGFAQACSHMVTLRFFTTGKRDSVSIGNPAGRDAVLELDTFRTVDAVTLASPIDAPFDTPVRQTGDAAYIMLATRLGSAGVPTLTPFATAYFQAITNKQAALSKAERRQVLDSLGVAIDGLTAGAWFDSLGVLLETPVPTTGVKVIAFLLNPQIPVGIVMEALRITQDASGNFTNTRITSGPITIRVLNVAGVDALPPIITDLSQTGSTSNPFIINLQAGLAPAAYTMLASVVIDGTSFQRKFPFMVVPPAFVGSNGISDPPNFPGLYVVTVDTSGNAVGGAFNVTEGSIVLQQPGSGIVKASTNRIIRVNGKEISSPDPWSRVVSAPAQ